MNDSLLRWAMIQRKIRDAQDKVKEEIFTVEGLTKRAFSDLHDQAVLSVPEGEVIHTEYGNVQQVNGSITWRPSSHNVKPKPRLILIVPEKEK